MVIALDASNGTTAEVRELGDDAAAGEETWLPGSTSEPAQLLAVTTATNMIRKAPDLFASDILRVSHCTRPRAVDSRQGGTFLVCSSPLRSRSSIPGRSTHKA
jgi:hypothetical protein